MPRRPRWPLIVAIVVLLSALILIGLPYLIKKLAQDWFIDQGLQTAEIRDVDFNPFTGLLVFHDLSTVLDSDTVLRFKKAQLEADWWPLIKHRVRVNELRLVDADIVVEQRQDGAGHTAGLPNTTSDPTPEDAEPGEPWYVGVTKLEVTDTRLQINLPKMQSQVRVDSLSISDLYSWAPDKPARVLFAGAINDSPLTVEAAARPFAELRQFDITAALDKLKLAAFGAYLPETVQIEDGTLDLDIVGRLNQQPDGKIAWQQGGPVRLNQLRLKLGDTQLQKASMDWDGEIDFNQSSGQLRWSGPLKLSDVAASSAEAPGLEVTVLEWEGSGDMALEGEAGPMLDGQLLLEDLRAELPQARVATLKKLTLDRLHVQGSASQQLTGLSLSDVSITEQDTVLTRLGKVQLQSARRDAQGTVGVSDIVVQDAGFVQPANAKQSLARIGRLALNTLQFVPETAVSLGDVQIDALETALVIDEHGQVNGLSSPPSAGVETPAAMPAAAKEPAGDEKRLHIKVASVAVAKGSHLTFTDRSVEPDYTLQATVRSLRMGGLDSLHPEKPGDLKLDLALNEYGSLNLAGSFAPLTSPPNMDLSGKLSALELLPASPYSEEAIGYQLQSGQAAADISIKIQGGELDVNNALQIGKLKVKAVPDAKNKLSVPLETGLAMLRDKNGKIKLDLPITGRYNDPDFDVSDVINQALGKALQTAAASYLVYALQPYGAALAAVKLAGKVGSSVSLEPLQFDAGQASLPEGQADYLSKLAKLLEERPQLGLRFCGKATLADRIDKPKAAEAGSKAESETPPVLSEQTKTALKTLAAARGKAIKSTLIERYKLGADRLYDCAPELDLAAGARPRVEVSL